MKILDGYGIEVAIPSIAYPMDTSYAVMSRETGRFVNEIHDHKEELRSEFYEEERGTTSIKENCASPLSIPPTEALLYTKRTTPTK